MSFMTCGQYARHYCSTHESPKMDECTACLEEGGGILENIVANQFKLPRRYRFGIRQPLLTIQILYYH